MDEASLLEGKLMLPTIAVVISTVTFVLILLFIILCPSREGGLWLTNKTPAGIALSRPVPFITIDDPAWTTLTKALYRHDSAISSCLEGLSASLEVAQTTEQDLFGKDGPLSKSLQQRIDRLSQILEQDRRALDRLLVPFPAQKALTGHFYSETLFSCREGSDWSRPSKKHGPSRPATSWSDQSASYESALQVIAQMVRDWTLLGSGLRASLYDWCRQQLCIRPSHVLVPGAGLGRLAYDIAQDGHSVEANEVSLVMAAVAYFLFSAPEADLVRIHPFALDYFTNEVHEEQRYESVEIAPPNLLFDNNGSLSYTLGDFSLYSTASTLASFDAVVTCFFTDTATNVYEYIAIIANLLKPGGRWINVGPLQWHLNAQLKPSASELKEMIQATGVFRFQHWSLDDDAMDYRMDQSSNRTTTRDEGFRPLRWVAVKRKGSNRLLQVRLTTPTESRNDSVNQRDTGQQKEEYLSTVTIERL